MAKRGCVGEGANPAVPDKETRDLLKEARRYLPDLEKRAKATKLETGLLAMVEWGLVEWRLDAANEAIRILKRASELGSEGSFPRVVARANAALAKVATAGGSGGDDAGGDPSVLFKVAEDLRGRGKFVEAVGAYRKVVRAGSAAPDTLRKYVYPAWFAMGQCYDAQKLPMEAAACYDVLLDEARAGRVTPDKADDTTKRLVRDSMERWRKLLNDLAALTGDSSDKARSSQATDYTIKELPKWIPGGEAVVGDLAFRRAARVEELITQDDAALGGRIRTAYHGESKPIASNDTEDGRALNRRVEMFFYRPKLGVNDTEYLQGQFGGKLEFSASATAEVSIE